MNHQLIAQIPVGGDISGVGPGPIGQPITTIGDTMTRFNKVISNLIGFLTVIAGIYLVFQFIFGAYEWITAGGDSQKVQSAQKKILNGVIGLVIVIAAVFVIDLIGAFLGLDILSPAEYIENIWN